MRKITLFAGLVVASMGLATVGTTSSAFAAVCLNPDAGTLDLTHNAMQAGAGWGYDKNAYDAEMAKGNVCPNTEQSVSTDQLTDYNKSNAKSPAMQQNNG